MDTKIGRRIFYESATGNIIQDTGERSGSVVETTPEQDFAAYSSLADRVTETVGVLQLEYGQYAQDFAESNGYRVNVETKILEFSYPDPNTPEEPPVFQRPLTEQVREVKAQTEQLNEDLFALSEYVTGGV